ncbi:C-reactive protein-like [Heterodontus francisci]|uniref:C-reactive protein-like n=1 Tax=Heterodontus francisci TaxID=7792 RepID=UPI00355ADCA7
MKTFIPFVLVVCIYLPVSANKGLAGKSLTFPTKTKTSSVKLYPIRCPDLLAFTLCMTAASEETRSYGLFSYATSHNANELMIWKGKNGEFSLYLSRTIVSFSLPEMNGLLRHICVTWESRLGLVTFWVNGERSVRKVSNKSRVVRGHGTFILGQEQDSVGGSFDIDQSFVGEITNVNLWDHVLTASEIKVVSESCHGLGGNIINWESIQYGKIGEVKIEDNQDCTV